MPLTTARRVGHRKPDLLELLPAKLAAGDGTIPAKHHFRATKRSGRTRTPAARCEKERSGVDAASRAGAD